MRFLRGLKGRVLPCGCLVGVYETYDGNVVTTIDARDLACDVHRRHQVLGLGLLDDATSDRTTASQSSVGRP